MLQFKSIKDNLIDLKKYFDFSSIKICDLTLGVRFMWDELFNIEYAIFNDTLILKENNQNMQNVFYYPIGNDINASLSEIENYTKKNSIPLVFGYLDDEKLKVLQERYYICENSFDRNWSDYVYFANEFISYQGKKLSGQRNHVNKFKKLYSNYQYKNVDEIETNIIIDFINKCEENADTSTSAQAEKHNLIRYVKNYKMLNQVGLALMVDNKIVAISFGEVVGDTMYVHIEKALRDYTGAYPMMAQGFAQTFCKNVSFINREEDCGDLGLRTSKLQYHPIEIKNKYLLKVNTLFDRITAPIKLFSQRLEITDILKEDKQKYKELYLDEKLNKYWGYDYREDLNGDIPTADYFYNFMQGLKDKKEEYSLSMRVNNEMIGELVLHNFDYFGGVEIGFRLFEKYQHKGYAFEGASKLVEYIKNELHAKTIYDKCYKQNTPSRNLITKLGFIKTSEDDIYYYFTMKV